MKNMEICKFNGNSTASVEGMQHVAKLIMNNQPTIAILSAAEDVTKHLDEIAACFFNRNTEEAHEKITRLEIPGCETELAAMLIRGQLSDGQRVRIDSDGSALSFRTEGQDT